MHARKPALAFILVVAMLDALGIGLLIPVAPMLVQRLMHSDEAHAAPYVGLLGSVYAVLMFLVAPTLGALSDRLGRRPILLFALLGSGIDYFAMALAPSLWILFVTRAINGATGASYTVASAYIADVTPPEKRGGAFGMMGAAFGVGFVLGPLLGGSLGSINIRWPFYAAGTITLINWLYGVFVLPESLPIERRAHFKLARANPVRVFHGLLKYPVVAGLAAALFFVYLAQFGLYATWALYMQKKFGWDPWWVGLSLFAVGVGGIIVQGGLTRRVIPALGERKSLLFGLFCSLLAYIGYGAASQGWMIFAVLVVGCLAGLAPPAAQSLITRTVHRDEQGATQGALTGVQSIATIIGYPVGGLVFEYAAEHLGRPLWGLDFFVGAVFAGIGLVVAAWATQLGGGPTPMSVQADEETDPAHHSPAGLVGEVGAAPAKP